LISILKRKVIDHYRKINSKKAKIYDPHHPKPKIVRADSNFLEEQVADPMSLLENSQIEKRGIRPGHSGTVSPSFQKNTHWPLPLKP